MLYMICFTISSFLIGSLLMGVHHEAVHKESKWYYATALLTSSWYLKHFHQVHHDAFLEGVDEFNWARRGESFYAFFIRTHLKRRTFGWTKYFFLDVLTFVVFTYFFGIYYIAMVAGFILHWEMLDYWSHYGLKELTDNKYHWSWNVKHSIFNFLTFDIGFHSKHHATGEGYYPLLYMGKNFFLIYRPLFPKNFFKYMDKQVIINREKGVKI